MAALFLIGTLVMVLLGIFGRLLSFQIRGTDAYAGYFMAGAGFLALAHTLMRGEHIRVTLLLEHSGRHGAALAGAHGRSPRRCCSASRSRITARDWRGSRTPSTTSPPATTPRRCGFRRSSMAIGNVILAIAFIDLFVAELRGTRRMRPPGSEPAHVE